MELSYHRGLSQLEAIGLLLATCCKSLGITTKLKKSTIIIRRRTRIRIRIRITTMIIITPAKTPNSNKPIKMLREFRTRQQARNDNTFLQDGDNSLGFKVKVQG